MAGGADGARRGDDVTHGAGRVVDTRRQQAQGDQRKLRGSPTPSMLL